MLFIKEITIKNEYVQIEKNNNYISIIENNFKDHAINIFLYKSLLRLVILYNNNVHYGNFTLHHGNSFIDFLRVIMLPSNLPEKITIIEGWSRQKLNLKLKNNFKNYTDLMYDEVLADTYFFNKDTSFSEFKKILKKNYIKEKNKYKSHDLLKRFSFREIIIIGSLLEKEGKDNLDKKKIYSVIINRLNKNMKLQIDATVIYALTKGKKELNRNLTYKDLKIKSDYNTYHIFGLPPEPISYVGNKTIELIFENYKSEYLFYFYDKLKKTHIYSKNYKNHLKKLHEYRQKK